MVHHSGNIRHLSCKCPWNTKLDCPWTLPLPIYRLKLRTMRDAKLLMYSRCYAEKKTPNKFSKGLVAWTRLGCWSHHHHCRHWDTWHRNSLPLQWIKKWFSSKVHELFVEAPFFISLFRKRNVLDFLPSKLQKTVFNQFWRIHSNVINNVDVFHSLVFSLDKGRTAWASFDGAFFGRLGTVLEDPRRKKLCLRP